jgi:hypothetical protein
VWSSAQRLCSLLLIGSCFAALAATSNHSFERGHRHQPRHATAGQQHQCLHGTGGHCAHNPGAQGHGQTYP